MRIKKKSKNACVLKGEVVLKKEEREAKSYLELILLEEETLPSINSHDF